LQPGFFTPQLNITFNLWFSATEKNVYPLIQSMPGYLSYKFKALLFILVFMFCRFFVITATSQIDTIYKYNADDRVVALWQLSELHLYSSGDSVNTYKAFDTLIQGAKQHNDERMRWYCEFFKLLFKTKLSGSLTNQAIVLHGMQHWVDNCPLSPIKALYKHQLGSVLFYDKKTADGLVLLLQAEDMFEKTGFKNMPEISFLLYQLANVYYALGDYKKSIQYAKISEAYRPVFNNCNVSNLNTVALAYRKLGDFKQAKIYFFESLDRARHFSEDVWVAIVSGNLGRTLLMQNNYKAAIPYLLADYHVNHINYPDEAFYAALDVAGCYAKIGDLNTAKFYFEHGMKLKDSTHGAVSNTSYYRSLYRYYGATGNTPLAFRFADSLIIVSDSLKSVRNANLLSSTQTRVESENHLSQLALEQERAKNKLIIKNIITGSICITLLAVLLLVYNRYRGAVKDKVLAVQEKQIANIEKKAAQERLSYADDQLNTYIKSIAEKNNLIEQINARLYTQGEEQVQANTERLQKKSELLEFTILTEDDVEKFKRLFDEVHPNFFNILKEQYPAFTQAEIRLLSLLKLNISHKEMSYIVGVSTETVTKAKYRLRKKLTELNINKELQQFVREL